MPARPERNSAPSSTTLVVTHAPSRQHQGRRRRGRRTTDPVPRFSRGYFDYVCRVSVSHCHCRLTRPISAVWPRQISKAGAFRYWFPRLVRVMSPHDTYLETKEVDRRETPRVPQISPVLPFPRTDCVESRRLLLPVSHPPSLLQNLFSSSSSTPSFPPHSIFVDASRCLAEIPAVSSSLFSRDGAQEWGKGEEGRKERAGCLFGATVVRPDTFYRAVNAGCGGLVRSIELFYGPRQIYRPPLSPRSSLPAGARSTVSTPRSSISTVFSARLDLLLFPPARQPD